MIRVRILLRVISILLTDPRVTVSLFKNVIFLFFLRIKLALAKKKIIIAALTEHLGDIVAAEPVAAHLSKAFPGSFICWIIDKKYRALAASHPGIHKAIGVSCFSEWVLLKKFLPARSVYDLHINNKVCARYHLVNGKENPGPITYDNYFDEGNLLHAFSRSAGIIIPDDTAPVLYLEPDSQPEIPGKYIVIHTSSNNPQKEWADECWNKLGRFVLENFKDYSIAEIGLEKKMLIPGKRIIDMTGEKDLSFIAGLIRRSSLFVGIDSGFAHFANAMNKESVILIGALDNFRNYMPYSGKFMKEKEETIVYYPAPLNGMPCNSVFNLVSKKLSR